MKNYIKTIFFYFIAIIGVQAQEPETNYIEKVKTLDSTLETLYKVISGEKGEERNWELFKFLFKPDAKLIPSGKNKEGTYGVHYMSPDNYIESSGKWLVNNGFFEKEIHRTVHTFGNITQVFSTYESFKSKTDKKPFMRGINSIQLLNDGKRWWVINIYWTQETKENQIPKEYLPKM
ncbi:hypothetical protein [uncultured Aquimarina sp.]|uniref:hypothetical protein n=1 Tax=uncultured Aquimarina sp. TaxID=575652 RepID=UPI0026383BDE|nr:hypothetical protein [uncultured Aquimarina sp.]